MYKCPHCTGWMERVRRSALERIVFAEVFICLSCGRRVPLWRPRVSAIWITYRFIVSRFSRCICCGSGLVFRTQYSDSLTKNPLGRIQRLFGAPLVECSACRRNYFDWRRPRPERRPAASPVPAGVVARDLAALGRAIGEVNSTGAPHMPAFGERRPVQTEIEK